MCYVLLCIALDIPPTLSLFHHLYVTVVTNDCILLSFHCGGIHIYEGLPSSIKKWKKVFFFVDASTFTNSMQFGSLVYRNFDADPELSVTERDIIKRLIAKILMEVLGRDLHSMMRILFYL